MHNFFCQLGLFLKKFYNSKPFFLNSYVNKNFAILQSIVPGYIIASVTAGAVSVAIAATVLTIYLKKSTNGELVQPYCYKGQEYCIIYLYYINVGIWLAISNTLNHRCRITWFWNTISNSAETVMARPIIRAKTWANGRMKETQDIKHYHIQSITHEILSYLMIGILFDLLYHCTCH